MSLCHRCCSLTVTLLLQYSPLWLDAQWFLPSYTREPPLEVQELLHKAVGDDTDPVLHAVAELGEEKDVKSQEQCERREEVKRWISLDVSALLSSSSLPPARLTHTRCTDFHETTNHFAAPTWRTLLLHLLRMCVRRCAGARGLVSRRGRGRPLRRVRSAWSASRPPLRIPVLALNCSIHTFAYYSCCSVSSEALPRSSHEARHRISVGALVGGARSPLGNQNAAASRTDARFPRL